MFKKIPGSRYYRIALDGTIIDPYGAIYEPEKTRCGKVTMEMFGTDVIIDIRRLSYLAWYESETIPELISQLDNICFQRVRSRVLKITCGYIQFFKEPIEYRDGFRVIPSHPRYAINRQGDVLDILTNSFVTDVAEKYQYKVIRIRAPDKSMNRSIKLHRLLALAWIPNSDYNARPYINHVDGNKLNNDLSNLEWVSSRENVIHAVVTGLQNCSIKMQARDAITGEVTIYDSIAEVSKALGVTVGLSQKTHLYKMPGHLYKGRYEIKPLADTSPWYYEKHSDIIHEPKTSKAHYVITVFNKDECSTTRFYRIRDLKKHYGVRTEGIDNIELAVVAIRKKYPRLDVSYVRNALRGPYYAKNLKTSNIIVATSLKELASAIDRGFNELQIDLTRKYKFIYDKTWIVTTDPKNLDITEYVDKSERYPRIEVTRVTDGKGVVFRSISEVARRLGIQGRTVSKYLNSGEVFKGYNFRALGQ